MAFTSLIAIPADITASPERSGWAYSGTEKRQERYWNEVFYCDIHVIGSDPGRYYCEPRRIIEVCRSGPHRNPVENPKTPGLSQVVGVLPNGFELYTGEIVNYDRKPWAKVGNVGWVYKDYLDCQGDSKILIYTDPMFKSGMTEDESGQSWFECFVSKEIPPSDHDVYKISIQVEYAFTANGSLVSALGVVHHAKSGTYNRASQYVNTILQSDNSDDIVWTGNPRNDPSKTMTGRMRSIDKNNPKSMWVYSEEITTRDGGKFDYRMDSICHLVRRQAEETKIDYDMLGNEKK